MRLIDVLNDIFAATDMNPGTEAYKDELRRLVNSALEEIYSEGHWTFLQRAYEVTAHADASTTVSVTLGSNRVTGAGFASWMEGNPVIGPDGDEYTVSVFESPSVIYLDRGYGGSTGTGTAKFKHRYLHMPLGCSEVIDAAQRASTEASWKSPPRFLQLTRMAQQASGAPLDRTGTPVGFIVDVSPTMPPAPTSAPSVSAVAGSWPDGTYDIAVGLYAQGVYGPRSPAASVALSGGQAPSIDVSNVLDYSNEAYKIAVWLRPSGHRRFRLLSLEDAGSATLAPAPPSLGAWHAQVPEERAGYRLRLRLYPRQSADATVLVRYLYRPAPLADDQDAVELPPGMAALVTDIVLSRFYTRNDRPQAAAMHARRARELMRVMRSRWLAPGGKSFARGGWRDWQLRAPSVGRVTPV